VGSLTETVMKETENLLKWKMQSDLTKQEEARKLDIVQEQTKRQADDIDQLKVEKENIEQKLEATLYNQAELSRKVMYTRREGEVLITSLGLLRTTLSKEKDEEELGRKLTAEQETAMKDFNSDLDKMQIDQENELGELLVRESLVTEDRTKLDTKWQSDIKIFQEKLAEFEAGIEQEQELVHEAAAEEDTVRNQLQEKSDVLRELESNIADRICDKERRECALEGQTGEVKQLTGKLQHCIDQSTEAQNQLEAKLKQTDLEAEQLTVRMAELELTRKDAVLKTERLNSTNSRLAQNTRRLENDLAEVKEENRLCSERLVGLEDLREEYAQIEKKLNVAETRNETLKEDLKTMSSLRREKLALKTKYLHLEKEKYEIMENFRKKLGLAEENLRRKRQGLEENARNMDEEHSLMDEQKAACISEIRKNEELYSRMDAELQDINEQIKAAEEEKSRKEMTADAAKHRLTALVETEGRMQDELHQLKQVEETALKEARQEKDRLRALFDARSLELLSAKESAKALQENTEVKRQELRANTDMLQDLSRKSAKLEAEVQSKMEKKERGTQELATARMRRDAVAQDLLRGKENLQELAGQWQRLSEEHAELKAVAEAQTLTEAETNTIRDKVLSIKHELEKIAEHKAEVLRDIQSRRNNLQDLERAVVEEEMAEKEYRAGVELTFLQIDHDNQMNRKAKEDYLTELRSKLEDTELRLKEKVAEHDKMEEEKDMVQQQIRNLETIHIKELEDEIASLEKKTVTFSVDSRGEKEEDTSNRMPPPTPRTLKSPSKASPAKSSQKTKENTLVDDMKSPDPSPKKITTTSTSHPSSSTLITTSEASPADKSTAAKTAIARKGTPTEKSTIPGRKELTTPKPESKDLTTPKSGGKDLTTPKSGGKDLLFTSTQKNPSQTATSVPESGVMTSAKKPPPAVVKDLYAISDSDDDLIQPAVVAGRKLFNVTSLPPTPASGKKNVLTTPMSAKKFFKSKSPGGSSSQGYTTPVNMKKNPLPMSARRTLPGAVHKGEDDISGRRTMSAPSSVVGERKTRLGQGSLNKVNYAEDWASEEEDNQVAKPTEEPKPRSEISHLGGFFGTDSELSEVDGF